MRQVIIVLFALLAVSIFMPAIMAKQGFTTPFLVGTSNLTKTSPVQPTPNTAIFGITSSMRDFINGTASAPLTNAQAIKDNNNGARWDILSFLEPEYIPPTYDIFPVSYPVFKKHVMS